MSSTPPPPPGPPPAAGGDDEALSWAGDAQPTGAAPSARDRIRSAKPNPLQQHETAETPRVESAPVRSLSNASLILYGVFGGVGILFTVGWILVVGRFGIGQTADPVAGFMGALGNVLAVAAPLFWGLTVFVLTRADARPTRRLLWLLAGVVVLVPWPFVLGWN